MSDYEPTEPYIIQNGALYPVNDYGRAGRIWKVVVPGGPTFASIERLTRWEAEKILDALKGENLRARIAELEARLALAENVCKAAFKALDLHEEAYLGHTSDCGSWDGTTATACDCGWLDAHSLSCEARRLKAELEAK